MNRRGFLRGLAALPVAAGGLFAIPKVASPDRVAPSAPVAGSGEYQAIFRGESMSTAEFMAAIFGEDRVAVDPWDEWLAYLGDHGFDAERYRLANVGGVHTLSIPQIEPIPFEANCRIDGSKIYGSLDSVEIDFHREAVIGEISEPYLRGSEISFQITVDDGMTEAFREWAEAAEEAARSAQQAIEDMVFADIVPAGASPGGMNDLDLDRLMTVIRTSKPARLA